MAHFTKGWWAHNWNLWQILFALIVILIKDEATILLMSRQLSCRDMYKIVTWSGRYCSSDSQPNCVIFVSWTFKPLVKWVPDVSRHSRSILNYWLNDMYIPRSLHWQCEYMIVHYFIPVYLLAIFYKLTYVYKQLCVTSRIELHVYIYRVSMVPFRGKMLENQFIKLWYPTKNAWPHFQQHVIDTHETTFQHISCLTCVQMAKGSAGRVHHASKIVINIGSINAGWGNGWCLTAPSHYLNRRWIIVY